MSKLDPERLLSDALSLSNAERAMLAARLIDSLDQQMDKDAEAKWNAEVERRVQELDAGVATTIGWPELRKRLMGRLNDSSAA